MENKFKLTLVALLVFIVLISAFLIFQRQDYVVISNEKISVEIADTPEKMQKGLMFREHLCHDCGMLFIFPYEAQHTFWMKNTLIPLQMIFINSEFKIVDVLEAEPCHADPCKQYIPSGNALYVLEVNKGRFNTSIIGKPVKIVS